jgi:hypothetical protein
MEQVIVLDESDDITAVRSRLDFAQSHRARQSIQDAGGRKPTRFLLIVPRKNQALQSLVNMKLLARWAQGRAVELAIDSVQPSVRDYAKEAGIKAFGSQARAKWAGWITEQTPVVTIEETIAPVAMTPSAQELEADPARKEIKRRRRQKKKYKVVTGSSRPNTFSLVVQQVGVLLLILVLALFLVMGVIALLPRATVTVTPVARPVETEMVVRADPNVESVDFETLTFPARVAQAELELFGEIETVETELAPRGLATGQVVFINRTADEQVIPISTTLATSAGEAVEFSTVETATIPVGVGATSTPTLVIAVEPGPKGNVAAGQLNRFARPSYALLARVINEQPLNGGTLEPEKIVVQTDKERLDAYLRQKVQQAGLSRLQASLGEQEFIPPESVQVIVLDVNYQEFSGDFSDTFGGEMQAVIRATVIGGYNANRLALAALEAQVPPEHELDLEGLNFGAGEILDIQAGIVTFRIFASGQAIPVIDGRTVARDIAWLSVGEAQELLGQQHRLATVPGVEVEPAWLAGLLGRLPLSPLRINVIVNDAITYVAEGS